MILLSLAQVLLSRSLLLQLAGADITAANTPESLEPTGQDDTKLGDSEDFSLSGWLSVQDDTKLSLSTGLLIVL